ncbi:MAG: geranylgeranyl reductase family protein [Cyclobacteriaceae bacterium]
MSAKDYDIVIVGAGPAGCACAYQLRDSGLKVALIDKDSFPRDKICGDALSADVINQFYRMETELGEQLKHFVHKTNSHGVRFVGPNHVTLNIKSTHPETSKLGGYTARRKDFDHFFFNQLSGQPHLDLLTGRKLEEVTVRSDRVEAVTTGGTLNASIIVGADGANSVVNRKLTNYKMEKTHFCGGLRQYYENVSGFHEGDYIELHFYKDLLPGYFWIFPLPNNQANVGLAMLSSEISRQRIDLKAKLKQIIENHPNVKHRFVDAKPLEPVKGFGLPIGSKKQKIAGDRFLLLGDAASLIDPFTGEGIGNAIRSGRIAAEHLIKACQHNRFDAAFNQNYSSQVYDKMWKELRLSRGMQKLLRYPRLLNLVFNKAHKNESVQLLLSSMLHDVNLKSELIKPSFYFKLIFS